MPRKEEEMFKKCEEVSLKVVTSEKIGGSGETLTLGTVLGMGVW